MHDLGKKTDTTEINKLSVMLAEAGIKHDLKPWHDGLIIVFAGGIRGTADICQFDASFGINEGCLESIRLREAKDEEDDTIQIWPNAESAFAHLLTIRDVL